MLHVGLHLRHVIAQLRGHGLAFRTHIEEKAARIARHRIARMGNVYPLHTILGRHVRIERFVPVVVFLQIRRVHQHIKVIGGVHARQQPHIQPGGVRHCNGLAQLRLVVFGPDMRPDSLQRRIQLCGGRLPIEVLCQEAADALRRGRRAKGTRRAHLRR